MFVEGLNKALKARGIKVSVKQLIKYFDYIKEVYLWFPQEGTIDEKRWKRVGDALKDYYQTFGPEKVLITAFSYWNLIDEILSQKQKDPVVAGAIEAGEKVLRQKGLTKPWSLWEPYNQDCCLLWPFLIILTKL